MEKISWNCRSINILLQLLHKGFESIVPNDNLLVLVLVTWAFLKSNFILGPDKVFRLDILEFLGFFCFFSYISEMNFIKAKCLLFMLWISSFLSEEMSSVNADCRVNPFYQLTKELLQVKQFKKYIFLQKPAQVLEPLKYKCL